MITDKVLAAVAEHPCEFDLHEPAQVTVRVCVAEPRGTVQISGKSLPSLASELLAWADTLTGIAATAWRPENELLHLEIRGNLTDNTRRAVSNLVRAAPTAAATVISKIVSSVWPAAVSWAKSSALMRWLSSRTFAA